MLATLAEMRHTRCIEGRLVVIPFQSEEVLQIGVLSDLFDCLNIREPQLFLDDQ